MVRVWTTPDTVGGAAVPMQLSVSAVQHYQQYTGIQQGRGLTTKWDLLAVPGKMGAVENWALLMMDPERCVGVCGGVGGAALLVMGELGRAEGMRSLLTALHATQGMLGP